MAEMAVSFAIDQLLPLLTEEANLLKGVHKEFSDIKDELESIQAFLKDADKRAATEADNNGERVKIWVRQVREAAFRIENVVDEHMIYLVRQTHDQPHKFGCAALLHLITHLIEDLKQRHQIASEIQDIKSSIQSIKERSESYGFKTSFEQGSSSSSGSRNSKLHALREAALYNEEADVVGFEAPRKILIDWMVKGREERTVVSVVGMGGQGKTTLAKKVFDSKDIIGHFDCHVWITVSQSYNVEGLLREMLLKFYKQKGNNTPRDISQMDRGSLIDELRNYLQKKRYVVVFDDVWSEHFWDDIQFALIDNKIGSNILITTRKLDVVVSCKRSSFVEVLELQPLTQEQSLKLFNEKAFRFDYGGYCPQELTGIANEIVKKCKGLPLAIVAIGGLLSTKEKNVFEWQRFSEDLSLELNKDTHLIAIKEILGLSYDDLPYYLKSCLLYFGIYPEDYEVKSKRVIRHWIAEGFVKEEKGKTLEEVAEGYLTELMHRSLVQVSSVQYDGKAKGCRVHDLIRDMILEKFEHLNFCKHISEDEQSPLSGITRRLSIRTISNDFMVGIESSRVWSLLFFTYEEIPIQFHIGIPTKYWLLKVLDYQSARLSKVPENLGNLIHLKYLSFWNTYVGEVPKSIGMLQNLETFDVRGTDICELPKEISKLRKLRHLMGRELSLIQLKDGIGEMKSLQTLGTVSLDMDGAAEVIKALEKLKQMRDLRLLNVRREDGRVLPSSLNEMQHLEKLHVKSKITDNDEFIDLNLISPPTRLQKLTLWGKLHKLPEWITEHQNLVVLKLKLSSLTKDPIRSLKSLQHLLVLSIGDGAYDNDLHFKDGWFPKLKELYVGSSNRWRHIIIDKGALPSLKMLQSHNCVPTGTEHLEKLEFLSIIDWEITLEEYYSDFPDEWIYIKDLAPFVYLTTNYETYFENSRS